MFRWQILLVSTALPNTHKHHHHHRKHTPHTHTPRWFVLSKSTLSYFKKQGDLKPQGAIALEDMMAVSLFPLLFSLFFFLFSSSFSSSASAASCLFSNCCCCGWFGHGLGFDALGGLLSAEGRDCGVPCACPLASRRPASAHPDLLPATIRTPDCLRTAAAAAASLAAAVVRSRGLQIREFARLLRCRASHLAPSCTRAMRDALPPSAFSLLTPTPTSPLTCAGHGHQHRGQGQLPGHLHPVRAHVLPFRTLRSAPSTHG